MLVSVLVINFSVDFDIFRDKSSNYLNEVYGISLRDLVDRINTVLLPSRQNIAQEELVDFVSAPFRPPFRVSRLTWFEASVVFLLSS